MVKSSEFNEYILELLSPLGHVRSRAMFGGYGVYVDEFFVAIIVDDTLFFKTNDETRPAFVELGCRPFVYESKGKHVSMSYFEAPIDGIDSTDSIAPWLKLALTAAKSKKKATRS